MDTKNGQTILQNLPKSVEQIPLLYYSESLTDWYETLAHSGKIICIVESLLNVFSYLRFKFSDPHINNLSTKSPPLASFCSAVSKLIVPLTNFTWGPHCNTC